MLGNAEYCRIGELPGTPDSGQALLGNMRLSAVGKVCDTQVALLWNAPINSTIERECRTLEAVFVVFFIYK